MFFVYGFLIIVLGMIFGSLGSVLLERLQNKHDRKTIKSILIGRSQCPKCKHTLGASELIPLASYLIQKGKCKHCKTHISAEYPILEIVSAIVFFITYRALYHANANELLILNNVGTLIFWIVTNWLLALLIIHDCKIFELHMPIRGILMARIRGRQIVGGIGNYKEAAIGLVTATIVFSAIYMFGKRYVAKRFHSNEEGFGQGDIFIGATLGSLVPFIGTIHTIKIDWLRSIEIILSLVILASIIGLLYFGISSLIGIHRKKSEGKELFDIRQNTNKIIPFIPSLILAFWILLYKADIILGLLF